MGKTKIDIYDLLEHHPGVTLSLSAAELGQFAKQLLADARREFERQNIVAADARAEILVEPEVVKSRLKISDSTLYRMSKAKILVPIWVAGQKRYRQSDIDKITN